ncbi:MAG: acetyl-CoA carboxylase biotin carboxylase subunit [Pusillimonas sp.]|nr:MAG: acetyl-CoA carboxylase biotin carboxylase subunit [Pusillimonas sp.]
MSTLTPFKKILIANRAEIALRVIRTARRMGLATVAVYSTIDRCASHVEQADEAVCIGDPEPSSSYLNIQKIIQAATDTGADAVHPGYGFLAENAQFAQACVEHGLVFIGPSPKVIGAMGDKARAKQLMRSAGVPCIPGYDGESQTPEELQAEADRIGYPVMIKATAGGGGRGMRLVESVAQFRNALASAQSEARASFGDSRVMLERALRHPRHIEIQIVADRHGNAIHLGDRDCSVQRRHQKIIEEAPAPGLNPDTRQAMGNAAVDAAHAIHYEGVGTLEFLVDTDGSFYFMEMNTRLQVEHSITEEITGLDLVEQQILVAAGKQLNLRQEDVTLNGHAIEVRLCAEDCAHDFMPQSGRALFWHAPRHARVESAIRSGDSISPYYDSMFAKIITHGPDRDSAHLRMQHALNDTVLFGLKTNLPLLRQCLSHPAWCQGGVSTSFISDYKESLLASESIDDLPFAVAAAFRCHRPGRTTRIPRQLAAPVVLFERTHEISVATYVTWNCQGSYEVAMADSRQRVAIIDQDGPISRLTVNDCEYRIWHWQDGGHIYLRWGGHDYTFIDKTLESHKDTSGIVANGQLCAASSCKITSVAVLAGQEVKRGDLILTTEAMKTEYQHIAPFAGTIREVRVQVGDQVSEDDVLAILDPQ